VLLAGIGSRMRGSAGGIGGVAETADDAYAKSFPVDELDIFLSHSWHTWWLLKYLTLLYWFNSIPAITVALSSSTIYMLLNHQKASPDVRNAVVITPWAQAIGLVSFWVTMLTWHHITALLKIAPTMFLDKVCIHQTDADLKVKGIKSIGAILANSKLMLVAWDTSYFERLWCTYEMSAFRKGNPEGRIKVLPVILGPFAFTYFLATLVSDVLIQGVEHTGTCGTWSRADDSSPFLLAVIHFPMFILAMRVMARYINNLKKLKQQLAHFSVRSAKCFCCDARHKHPDTGADLPCDREVVNNSIEAWMGMDTFDRMVRGEFKRFVKRTLGGRAKIPYRYAVAASIYPAITLADHLIAETELSWHTEVIIALEAVFLRHPLIIALTTATLVQYQARLQAFLRHPLRSLRLGETSAKWALYIISGWLMSVLYYMALTIAKLAVSHGVEVVWMMLEVCLICVLYFGGMLFSECAPMALLNDPIGEEWNSEPDNSADRGPARAVFPGRRSVDVDALDSDEREDAADDAVEMTRVSTRS